MSRRAFVFVVVFAAVFATHSPSRAEEHLGRRPVWSVALEAPAWGTATDNFGVVVSSGNGTIRALDRRGRTWWATNIAGTQDGDPAITRSRVLVGRAGRVVALARGDGAIKWHAPMDDDEVASVALSGRFALAGDASGTLRAFDAVRGTVRWSVHHDGAVRAPVRVDARGRAVVAVWTDTPVPVVRVLDLTTGAERWKQPIGDYTAAPQLSGGQAFVASGDGNYHAWVAAFDVQSGAINWKMELPGSFQSNIIPAVDARDLVVADWIGNVSSIDPTTGASRWSTPLNRYLVHARVVLLESRVAVATVDGTLFVLDRASGKVIVHADPRELHGWVGALAPFGRDALLVALRVTGPSRIEVHRLP